MSERISNSLLNSKIKKTSDIDRRKFLSYSALFAGAGAMGTMGGMGSIAHAYQSANNQFPKLTAIVKDYVATRKVSGMVAAIGMGDDAPISIAAGTLGLDNKTGVDLNSLWRIYSQTKPITGMAAMMLIGDGVMKLDQPIADFLPEFANMNVLKNPNGALNDVMPARTQITIRHLLTHTAGLGYNIISQGPIRDAYVVQGINPGQVSRNPIPGFPIVPETPDIVTFSKRLAALPLVYEPGTKWSYSVGLDVMGYIIQVATGMPMEEFLQKRMFDPLGMNNIFFQVPKDRIKDFASNYAPFAGTLFPIDLAASSIYLDKPPFAFGGAGLVSSAADYDKFLHMLMGFGVLNGTRIMEENIAKLGMSNLLPEGADLRGSWVANQGFGAGGRVGIGTSLSPLGTYGWGGAAGTAAFVDTERKFRAGGYTQYMPANAYPFQSDFAKYVYEDMLGISVEVGKTS